LVATTLVESLVEPNDSKEPKFIGIDGREVSFLILALTEELEMKWEF
jgi:hypothetical protein